MRDTDRETLGPSLAQSFRAAALMRKRARRRMGAGVSAKRAALHAAALGVAIPAVAEMGRREPPRPTVMASEKVDASLSKPR